MSLRRGLLHFPICHPANNALSVNRPILLVNVYQQMDTLYEHSISQLIVVSVSSAFALIKFYITEVAASNEMFRN